MSDKDNYLKSVELSTEQNANMIDGILNNAPLSPPPEEKPLERVKLPTEKKRSRDLTR